MKKLFGGLAIGSSLNLVALLILSIIKKIDLKFALLFVIAFMFVFGVSFIYLFYKDSFRVTEKLKILNKMTFGVEEKKDFVEIKNIKVNREECDWYKIYCNTLIEI